MKKVEAMFICMDCSKEIEYEQTLVSQKTLDKIGVIPDGDPLTFYTRCEECHKKREEKKK